MSAGGLLLRVVLMLSLLLNGLNVALAAPMALALLPAVAAETHAPPCHTAAPATAHAGHAVAHDAAGPDTQAPHDGDHCQIKDCLRNCAQQPSLTAQLLWLPTPPPLSLSPQRVARSAQPAPPLDRITRPPITALPG